MSRTTSRRAAFTLVEIMILIVVGLIIAAAAIPAATTLDDQRIAADARILESDLEFVQARAIATGVNHRVLFVPSTNRYQVEAPPGVVIDEPLTRQAWVRQLASTGAGSTLLSADFGGSAAVLFDTAGRPSAGGTVILGASSFQAEVKVEAVTGAVTVVLP